MAIAESLSLYKEQLRSPAMDFVFREFEQGKHDDTLKIYKTRSISHFKYHILNVPVPDNSQQGLLLLVY
jgi:hypothetical protein